MTTVKTMTLEQEIAQLRAENEALKGAKKVSYSMKVSEKGAVSVYGLGRFPVTLYMSQWQSLLDRSEDIKAYILANADILKQKEAAKAKV